MILNSQFVRFGTIVDEDNIPSHLRKKKFILRPGDVDYDARNLALQEEVARTEVDAEEISERANDDVDEEEENRPISNIANKRIASRR